MKHIILRLALTALAAVSLSSVVQAAEVRTWMSVKGSTIEAKLVKYEGETVTLAPRQAKPVTMKVRDLSLADRLHLVEYAEADQKILTEIELAEPEVDCKIDKKTFITHKEKMHLMEDSDSGFSVLETEHFIVASAGRTKPDVIAEMAERLWTGSAFQHIQFRDKWGDKKFVIFLIDGEEVYQAVGQWYINYLNKLNTQQSRERSQQVNQTWGQVSATGVTLPSSIIEKYNAFPTARVFRLSDSNKPDFRKVFGPSPTNSLANSILSAHLGGISETSARGYTPLSLGHSYYKEIQLAKLTNTQILDTSGSGGDEISSARGFDDGSGWAKELRKLVRTGKVKLELENMLSWGVPDLTPIRLVSCYSFSYYLQSDSARLANYAKLIRRIETNNQVPQAIEIAKICGFESVEELESDWTEFVKSTSFK